MLNLELSLWTVSYSKQISRVSFGFSGAVIYKTTDLKKVWKAAGKWKITKREAVKSRIWLKPGWRFLWYISVTVTLCMLNFQKGLDFGKGIIRLIILLGFAALCIGELNQRAWNEVNWLITSLCFSKVYMSPNFWE